MEFFRPARSMASSAPSSNTENTSSLISVVLRKTTHGLNASAAQSAAAVGTPNPASRNHRQARATNRGSMSQATGIARHRFSGKRESTFQTAASASGHSGGYLV